MTRDHGSSGTAEPVLAVRAQLDAMLSHLGTLDRLQIIDIGCGDSAIGRGLAERGADVTGIDPNMPALPWHDVGRGRFRIVPSAAENLPFHDAAIDIGLFIYSLHHVPKLESALLELHRVLKPGGKLYVAEPLAEGDCNNVTALFHDETTVRRQAAEILARVAAPMFRQHLTETYAERRMITDFDAFAERMIANRRFNGYTAEAVLAPAVRQKYAEIASRTNGVFDQPVRIDYFTDAVAA